MRLHSRQAVVARAFCGIGAVALFASVVCAQTGPDGHWEGTLKGDRGDIGVSLDWIRVAHASFQGTLNQEGTELAGQFQHEPDGVPMTLRKK